MNGPVSPASPVVLPSAAPGYNSYVLGDGSFWDFDVIPDGGIVVIENNGHLSVARAGSLVTASNPAGGALAIQWPQIYTSAPVLPGEQDSVQKFVYRDGALVFDSSRASLGPIRDLSVTDLDNDGVSELLVTVQRPEGAFIEVWETF
jgi:hypothetical protein